jgi:hypothetical protein
VGPDKNTGRIAEAGKPTESGSGMDPCRRFGNLLISAIAFLPIFRAESIYDRFFITDQPIKKGKRSFSNLFLPGATLDEFGLPQSRGWRCVSGLPNDNTLARADESETTLRPIPSGAGAIKFKVAVLPFTAVATGPLQNFRGEPFKAFTDQLVPAWMNDILSPEKHLLLQAFGEITKVTRRETRGGNRHDEDRA